MALPSRRPVCQVASVARLSQLESLRGGHVNSGPYQCLRLPESGKLTLANHHIIGVGEKQFWSRTKVLQAQRFSSRVLENKEANKTSGSHKFTRLNAA